MQERAAEDTQCLSDVIVPGTYVFHEDENFEEFLISNGANFIARKFLVRIRPVQTFTLDGETCKVKISLPIKTVELSFKNGDTVDTPSMFSMMPGQWRCTIEDGKFVQRPVDCDWRIERRFHQHGLDMIFVNGKGITGIRKFKKT